MSRRFIYNLLIALPLVLAVSFGLSLWQSGGTLLAFHKLPDGFNISGLFTVLVAEAQTSNCNDPVRAQLGQGRIYYNPCYKGFRISRGDDNSGAWEDLGELWKRFPSPNDADIYNINSRAVYVARDTIFGLGGIIKGLTTDPVIVLDAVNRSLIYGAVDVDSEIDSVANTAASLLKLESFDSISATPYQNILSVRIDGKVIIGNPLVGRLVTPEICLPNESLSENCIKSWTAGEGGDGGGGQTAADKFWISSSTQNQDQIENRNVLKDAPRAGGNVLITRDLTTRGSVYITKNPEAAEVWQTKSAKVVASNFVNDIFFDVNTSSLGQYTYDQTDRYGDAQNGTSLKTGDTSGHLALAALSNKIIPEGKIAVMRSGKSTNSAISEFKFSSDTGGTNILPVISDTGTTAVGLNAVCDIGNPDSKIYSVIKNYKIFAAGDNGEIWTFEAYPDTTYKGHHWVKSAIIVPAGVRWRDIECKQNDVNAGIWEVYIVGTNNAILRFDSSLTPSWLGSTSGSFLDTNGADINAIWLSNRSDKAPTAYNSADSRDVWARYFAAGAGGKIYYWNSGATSLSSVPTNSSYTFTSVGGQIRECNDCVARYVFFGGKNGVLYSANMMGSALTLEQLQEPTSATLDITGVSGGPHFIFVSLDSTMVGSGTTFLRYISISDLKVKNLPDRNLSLWAGVSDMSDNKITSLDALAYGNVTLNTDGTYKSYGNSQFFTILAGSTEGLAFIDRSFGWEIKEGEFKPLNQTAWETIMSGEEVNLASVWLPQNLNNFDLVNSFIGGDKGAILKNLGTFMGMESTTSQNLAAMQIAGLSGYDTAGMVYAVGSLSGKSYIFYKNSDRDAFTAITNYGFKLNDIWVNKAGNLIVAVGDGGRLISCQSNCSAANGWIPATWSGALNLKKMSGIYGSSNIYFIVDSAGKIYRCDAAPTDTACASATTNTNVKTVWVNTGKSEAWAAGDGGRIYKNTSIDSNGWTEQQNISIPGLTIANVDIRAIAGIGDLVFFGGTQSTIIKYKGAENKWDFNKIGIDNNLEVKAMASVEWQKDGKTQGQALAVGSNGLVRQYQAGGQELSGDLQVENNRWGTSSSEGGTGIAYKESPITSCLEGEFMVGLQIDSVTGKPTGDIYCRKL